MSNTAKRCPNCGYSVNNFNSVKPYLLGGVLGLVGLFVIILSFPVMSGWGGSIDPLGSEFYVGCAMFLCGLVLMLIGCRLLKKHFHRSMLLFVGLTCVSVISLGIYFLSVGFYHYEFNDSSADSNNTESSATTSEQDNLGTYVYIQPNNNAQAEKLVITLNEDETAVAKATKEGKEETYYGSWSYYSSCDGYILTFSDAYFTWGNRKTNLLDAWIDWAEAINVDGAVIRDGYLYANTDMAKAKNPKYRVKLERANSQKEIVDETETEAVACDSAPVDYVVPADGY